MIKAEKVLEGLHERTLAGTDKDIRTALLMAGFWLGTLEERRFSGQSDPGMAEEFLKKRLMELGLEQLLEEAR